MTRERVRIAGTEVQPGPRDEVPCLTSRHEGLQPMQDGIGTSLPVRSVERVRYFEDPVESIVL